MSYSFSRTPPHIHDGSDSVLSTTSVGLVVSRTTNFQPSLQWSQLGGHFTRAIGNTDPFVSFRLSYRESARRGSTRSTRRWQRISGWCGTTARPTTRCVSEFHGRVPCRSMIISRVALHLRGRAQRLALIRRISAQEGQIGNGRVLNICGLGTPALVTFIRRKARTGRLPTR